MFDSFKLWQSDGTWQKIPDTFREAARIQAGREPTPSAGSIDDGVAAITVLEEMKPEEFPRLSKIGGDNKYNNHEFHAWRKGNRPDWELEIKPRPEGSDDFVPVPKRWVVERTFAWFGHFRRLSKDAKKTISSSQAIIQIAGIQTLLHRLAPNCTKNKFIKTKMRNSLVFMGNSLRIVF